MKKNTKNQIPEKPGRGGKRPGAGRPVTGHARANYSLPPELIEALRQAAEADGTTASALLADFLREGLSRRSGG